MKSLAKMSESELRREYGRRLRAEHRATERADNAKPRSIERGWAAVERTNEVIRALRALRGES